MDHTNVPLYMITITNTYQTMDIETYPVHDISMCSDFGVIDCNCCSTWPELVGIGGRTKSKSNGKSSSNGVRFVEANRFSEASATA